MKHLAAIGFGYTAQALARRLDRSHWRITATKRTEESVSAIRDQGYSGFQLDGDTSAATLATELNDVTHILLSAAPTSDGDPIVERLSDVRQKLPRLEWIGYLSTIGVYGNHDGDWVDESTPAEPTSQRGQRRLVAEKAWQSFGAVHNVEVHTFRLPGIYGPGRSVFDRLKVGSARRINKPGQVFNRMHVDDIAGVLDAALHTASHVSPILTLSDDLPAPPQDVIAYAAELMGIEPPPEVPFDDAEMTDMARSFYGDNKRVSNRRLKNELSYQLLYPSYREGLQAVSRNANP